MLLIRTERAYITWRIMDKAMPNHLILAFESFAANSSSTSFDGTKVWTIL
jgi:hypothetical protein